MATSAGGSAKINQPSARVYVMQPKHFLEECSIGPGVMAIDDCVSSINDFTHLLKTPTRALPAVQGALTMPPTSCPSIGSCRASPAPCRDRRAAGATPEPPPNLLPPPPPA